MYSICMYMYHLHFAGVDDRCAWWRSKVIVTIYVHLIS